jgi:hypothetical protein
LTHSRSVEACNNVRVYGLLPGPRRAHALRRLGSLDIFLVDLVVLALGSARCSGDILRHLAVTEDVYVEGRCRGGGLSSISRG